MSLCLTPRHHIFEQKKVGKIVRECWVTDKEKQSLGNFEACIYDIIMLELDIVSANNVRVFWITGERGKTKQRETDRLPNGTTPPQKAIIKHLMKITLKRR